MEVRTKKSPGGGNAEAPRKGYTSADKRSDPSRTARRALVPSRQRKHPALHALRANLARAQEAALRDWLTMAIAALDQRGRP